MPDPRRVLRDAFQRAGNHLATPATDDTQISDRARAVVRSSTKAGIRAVLACCLAKAVDTGIDIRKPYTEIGDADSYSGRSIDEQYIGAFITEHDLPGNATTAWLTPAFRTNKQTLEVGVDLGGTPASLYENVILLLGDVHSGAVTAEALLEETIRQLLILRAEREKRLGEMMNEIGDPEENIPLSSEEIVDLIKQHLDSPRSSRLPVLVVTAAYEAAKENLGESVKTLYSHNAPDEQTGALGDVEITLADSEAVGTSYEMKAKEVKKGDVNRAIEKITGYDGKIDNYIFITTAKISKDVREYAEGMYRELGSVEIAVLDCIGFIRHFLHLFHRLRGDFLEAYQQLVIEEPESAVPQALKEVFLALRKAAESDE